MRTMTSRDRQRGSLGSYIVMFLIVGGCLSLLAKLGPLYFDHSTMSNVIDAMAMEPGHGIKTDDQLYGALKQRFKMNNIRDFKIKEHVKFDRTGRGTELIMDYEVRMPLVSNLDLIASFDKKALLRD